MKANELMLGDLFDVNRCECVADGGQYVQWEEYAKVVGISDTYITVKYLGREGDYDWEDVYLKDLEPIPLTHEILEKNFPDVESGVAWAEDESGDRFNIRVEYDLYIEGIFFYVHQLQHALRLCKIDKEIKL